jgi:hypothetical protein
MAAITPPISPTRMWPSAPTNLVNSARSDATRDSGIAVESIRSAKFARLHHAHTHTTPTRPHHAHTTPTPRSNPHTPHHTHTTPHPHHPRPTPASARPTHVRARCGAGGHSYQPPPAAAHARAQLASRCVRAAAAVRVPGTRARHSLAVDSRCLQQARRRTSQARACAGAGRAGGRRICRRATPAQAGSLHAGRAKTRAGRRGARLTMRERSLSAVAVPMTTEPTSTPSRLFPLRDADVCDIHCYIQIYRYMDLYIIFPGVHAHSGEEGAVFHRLASLVSLFRLEYAAACAH